jgi:hypothetical protein
MHNVDPNTEEEIEHGHQTGQDPREGALQAGQASFPGKAR